MEVGLLSIGIALIVGLLASILVGLMAGALSLATGAMILERFFRHPGQDNVPVIMRRFFIGLGVAFVVFVVAFTVAAFVAD
jgi:hypothetical protein